MASIERRKHPRTGAIMSYRVLWREGGIKQAETFGNEPDALDFKAAVMRAGDRWPANWVKGAGYADLLTPESHRPERAGAGVLTFGAVVAEYLDSDRHRMNPTTAKGTLRRLERHAPELWGMPIANVGRDAVKAWVTELNTRSALGTNQLVISNARAVMRDYLAVNNVQRPNPFDKVRADGTPKRKPRFLRLAEIEAISLELTIDPVLSMLAMLMLHSGLRSGEARALTVADLDLSDTPAIEVTKTIKPGKGARVGAPKSINSTRTVTIGATLADALRDYTRGKRGTDSVLGIADFGAYVYATKRWNAALERVSVAPARLHDLRHTHASTLLANGASLFAVSRRLGHSNIGVTANVYGHLDRADDRANANRIDAAFGPSITPAPRLALVQ